jgi:glycosyltransferase involved in cell wall biosynthesis
MCVKLDLQSRNRRGKRISENMNTKETGHNIGFVGTRFAGTDGVSLEASKWAKVLWDHRHTSYWFAGKLNTDPTVSMLEPHAYFDHPDIQWINKRIFGRNNRDKEVTRRIYAISEHLKRSLYDFVGRFEIEVLVVQNALCIPMNVPLGLAITTFIAETNFPTIAHHHDFYWERDRFAVNGIGDFLRMAFPPDLPSIQHATINSTAQREFSHRCGASSILVPNVLDFETPPVGHDEYNKDFRRDVGLTKEDVVFLQPTRIVPRKGIEHAISLVAALKNPKCKLVITHESGDEGDEYMNALMELAEHEGVDLRLIADRIDDERSEEDGVKIYDLADAYAHADCITYPSSYEGFGNALLEAFYCRKPVLVNRYSIFVTDIEPKGFQVITMNGFLTKNVVEQVKKVISDPVYRKEMVDNNFELGKAFFSYDVLRRKLRALITHYTGADNL